ncbi:MAG TPA: hypothetical protein VK427_00610 [Kofleriaceae bacterium]|nr:hypothetical protein [Kofleriaceae bacterium]
MRLALALVLLGACSSKPPTTTAGSGSTTFPPATGCESARTKVEQLYRAEANARRDKPERVTEAVSDNTTMVLAECNQAPDRVVPCVNRVASAAELEKECLAPLDDEGSEGEALRK